MTPRNKKSNAVYGSEVYQLFKINLSFSVLFQTYTAVKEIYMVNVNK